MLDIIYNILHSLRSAESVEFVYGASITNKLSKCIVEDTLINLFNNSKSNLEISADCVFIIKLIYKIRFKTDEYDTIVNVLVDIFTHKLNLPYSAVKEFINILDTLFYDISDSLADYKNEIFIYILEQIQHSANFDSEDIGEFINLVNTFDVNTPQIIEKINQFLNNEFLPNHLDFLVNENISINDIRFKDNGLEVVEDSIWSYVNKLQEQILTEIGEFSGISINEDAFISAIDIESINDMLVEQYSQDDEDRESGFSSNDHIKDIDQLFERNR